MFELPTYLFVASFFIVIALGAYAAVTSGGHPQPVVPPPPPPKAVEALTWWLILRAFASGCTAMTGVEAVSNGVGAFRAPQVTNARTTLSIIVMTLGVLLGGIAYLATTYGIMAMDQTQPGYQSVLSQLVAAVAGRGAFYHVAIGGALIILCLSANTSFVDFPRLCRFVAQDEFLPRPFAIVGRRLVYSVGILYLAVTAGLLLTVFGGITDRLIPLFAIGAFLTFTMSQAGMVAHWRRRLHAAHRVRKHRVVWIKLCLNAVGATATAAALVIIIVAKFTEGGWITILVIACFIALLRATKRYYERIETALRDDEQLNFHPTEPPLVLVMTREWDRLTDKALSFAMELSPDVIAVHLAALEGPDVHAEEKRLREQWAKHVEKSTGVKETNPPQLVFLSAPFRRIHAPLLKLIRALEERNPNRTIAVLIPELVKRHWWEYMLSNQRARRLRSAVLDYGGPRVVAIMVPWYLTPPKIEDALTEEEIAEPFHIRNVLRWRGHRRDAARST